MKEKYQLPIIAGSIVLIVAIFIGVVLLTSDKDENKKRYVEILHNIDSIENFHVIQTQELLNGDSVKSFSTSEVWASGDCYFTIENIEFPNKTDYVYETIVQLSDEEYSLYENEEGTQLSKGSGKPATFTILTYYNSLFNFWDYDNISYVEKEDGWIVTYNAKNMIGERVKNGNYSDSTYKSAVSVCQFDKDWNLQKIELTEVFDVVDESESQEYTQQTVIKFENTSQADIDKKIDEEYAKIQKEF